MTTKMVRCCDCGRQAEIDATHFSPPSWEYLQLTGRVRCPTCVDQLRRANDTAISPDPYRTTSDTYEGYTNAAPAPAPPADPPAPIRSGGGGDFGGGGATSSWDDNSSSSSSDSSASSSSGD